jgi:glycine betaine/proline transport system ATP-binding protein
MAMTAYSTAPETTNRVAVECRDVWKIFGPAPEQALAALRSEGLSKAEIMQRFDCVVGVAGVSFAVRSGEIFCVMGLSGSGKSTLVRHINGLIQPTAGQILIDGQDIAGKRGAELRKVRAEKIGMVFQNFALLPHRTVIENVAFGLELRDVPPAQRLSRANDMLKLVDLADWGHHWPHELSGGMQQRVGLARALAGDPDILLMDEPFGALDPLIRRQLQDEFLQLTRAMRKTTIFITHDLDEAMRFGSRIGIMRDGRLIQVGTAREIVRAPADSYVADFIAGISPIEILRAGDVMLPLGSTASSSWPRVRADTPLAELSNLLVGADAPVLVIDGGGQPLGMVDKDALLRNVQAGPRHD